MPKRKTNSVKSIVQSQTAELSNSNNDSSSKVIYKSGRKNILLNIQRKEKTEEVKQEKISNHSKYSMRSSTYDHEAICESMHSSNQAFNNYLNIDKEENESRKDCISHSKHSEGTS